MWRGGDVLGHVQGWRASTSYAWLAFTREMVPLRPRRCVLLFATRAAAARALVEALPEL